MCRLKMTDVIIKERSGSVTRDSKDKQRVVPLNVTARNALAEWFNVRGYEPGPYSCQKGMTLISQVS